MPLSSNRRLLPVDLAESRAPSVGTNGDGLEDQGVVVRRVKDLIAIDRALVHVAVPKHVDGVANPLGLFDQILDEVRGADAAKFGAIRSSGGGVHT